MPLTDPVTVLGRLPVSCLDYPAGPAQVERTNFEHLVWIRPILPTQRLEGLRHQLFKLRVHAPAPPLRLSVSSSRTS